MDQLPQVLTVVVGGSVVGVIVVGVAVVTASALRQPGQHSKTLMDTPFLVPRNVYIATLVKVARFGWPASAMCLACIQPIR